MKAIVLKPFYDAELKELYHENETIEISEEKFNEYVAAGRFLTTGGAGGSGGGGVSSWNELGEEVGEVVLLEETTVDTSQPNAILEIAPELVNGATYNVTFNGVDYECVCMLLEDETGETVYALGNTAVFGGEDNGYPFVLIVVPASSISLLTATDSSTSSTISIKGIGKVINPIPTEYLPEEVATKEYVNAVLGGIEYGTY